MFDREKLKTVIIKSKEERWEFPKAFKALVEAGVEYYEASLVNGETSFYGEGQCLADDPLPIKILSIAQEFDAQKVKQAIIKHQVEKTDYIDFIKDSALAGVSSYRVDMSARTVTYRGQNPGDTYIEKIPQF